VLIDGEGYRTKELPPQPGAGPAENGDAAPAAADPHASSQELPPVAQWKTPFDNSPPQEKAQKDPGYEY